LKDLTAATSRKAGRGGFRLRDPSPVGFADTLSRKGRGIWGSIPADRETEINEINALHKNARFRSPPSGTAAH
jgi:hypothetical protein